MKKYFLVTLCVLAYVMQGNSQISSSVNDGEAIASNIVYATKNATINLSVESELNDWVWSGPNGFEDAGTAISISGFKASRDGQYTALSASANEVFEVIYLGDDFFDYSKDIYACGAQNITLSAAYENHNYLWSTGERTTSIVVSSASSQTYTVTVTTDHGQVGVNTFNVENVENQTIELNQTSCDLFLEGPEGFLNYAWSNGGDQKDINISEEDLPFISLNATTQQGCLASFNYIVNYDATLYSVEQNITTCGGGTLNLVAEDGFEYYSWSTGENTQSIDISYDEPTQYSVTMFNSTGCERQMNFEINIESYSDITTDINLCQGQIMSLEGLGGFDSYQWSNGGTGEQLELSVMESATLSLLMSNENGCEQLMNYEITVFDNFELSSSIKNPSTCTQLGTATFELSNLSESSLPLNLKLIAEDESFKMFELTSLQMTFDVLAGNYPVIEVSNNFSCKKLFSGFDIENYEAIEEEITMEDVIVCPDSEFSLAALDGYVEYLWNNGSTEQELQLAINESQTLSVDMIEESGCGVRMLIPVEVINSLENVQVEVTTEDPISCDQEGKINLILNNVDPTSYPFTFEAYKDGVLYARKIVSNDNSTYPLQAGNYTKFTLKTVSGCIEEYPGFVVAFNNAINEELTMTSSEVCVDDTIELEALSGYKSYIWSDGTEGRVNNISPLETQDYYVDVYDNSGCGLRLVFPVIVHTSLENGQITMSVEEPISCDQEGTINLNLAAVANESYPLLLEIYKENIIYARRIINEPTVSFGLQAGVYDKYTVATSMGCLNEFPGFEIEFNTSVQEELTMRSAIVCFGSSVELTAFDGYNNYLWEDGSTSKTRIISPDEDHDYFVDLNDSNGCGLRLWFPVAVDVSLESMNVVLTTDAPVSCDQEGTVNLNLSNISEENLPLELDIFKEGSLYMKRLINDVQSNFGLVSGVYDKIVFSSPTNCFIELPGFEIELNESINEEMTMAEVMVCAGTPTSLEALAGFDSYVWNDGTQGRFLTIAPESNQNYFVDVFDGTGCGMRFNFPVVILDSEISTNETIQSLCAASDVVLTADEGFENYLWSTGETTQVITVSPLVSSEYEVNMNNGQGCGASMIFPIDVAETLTANFSVSNLNQSGMASLDVSVQNALPEMFPLSLVVTHEGEEILLTEMNQSSISVQLTAGDYNNLNILTSQSCEINLGDFVIENEEIVIIESWPSQSICAGDFIAISGPSSADSYTWSTGATTSQITVSPNNSAIYTVTATYSSEFTTFILENPIEVIETLNAIIEISNETSQELGSISIALSNGSSEIYPVTVLATLANVESTLGTMNSSNETFDLSAGNYSNLKLVSAEACETNLGNFEIEFQENQVVTETEDEQSTCLGNSINLTGPSNADVYLWSTGETSSSISLQANATQIYTVTATINAENLTYIIDYPVSIFQELSATSFATDETETESGNLTINLNNAIATHFPVEVSVVLNGNVIELEEMNAESITFDLAPGLYSDLSLTTGQGCVTSLPSFTINDFVNNEFIEFTQAEQEICEGETLTLNGPTGFINFMWNTGSNGAIINVSPDQSITYSVTSLDPSTNETWIVYFPIIVNENVEAEFTAIDESENESGRIDITLGNGYAAIYPVAVLATYNGSENIIGNMTNASRSIDLEPGSYTDLKLIGQTDCTYMLGNFTINSDPTSGEVYFDPIEACLAEQITIDAPSDYLTYDWSNGSSSEDLTVLILGSATYSVTMTAQNGNTLIHHYPVSVNLFGINFFQENDTNCDGNGGVNLDFVSEGSEIFPVQFIYDTENGPEVFKNINQAGFVTMPVGSYPNARLISGSGCEIGLGTLIISNEGCGVTGETNSMAVIAGTVWLDESIILGMREPNEDKLNGVIVRALNMEGDVAGVDVTNEKGLYNISLEEGSYYIEFDVPTSMTETVPNIGVDQTMDSDLDMSNGQGTTKIYNILGGQVLPHIDAGLLYGALPIAWENISATNFVDHNQVEWAITDQGNTMHYEIQRSVSSISQFKTIGRVEASVENIIQGNYSYDDFQLKDAGIYYYRIKQVSEVGKFHYSKVVSVTVEKQIIDQIQNLINIYPNPTASFATISVEELKSYNAVSACLIDAQGVTVAQKLFDMQSEDFNHNKIKIDFSAYPSGKYSLMMELDGQTVNKPLIIVND
mgnify:CR=1 FL=1